MTTLNVRPRSIVQGSDQECLQTLLGLHAIERPEIVDVTYGSGRMWKGTSYQPVRYTGNFLSLPAEWRDRFDVVVFDPPHVTEAGKGSRYYTHFDTAHADVQHRPDISHLYRPFLDEAVRVLRSNGIILAKLIDTVHRGVFRWQVLDFVQAVRETPGLTACDRLIRSDPRASTLVGPNWQKQFHLRRAECFWVVVRKGRCRRAERTPNG